MLFVTMVQQKGQSTRSARMRLFWMRGNCKHKIEIAALTNLVTMHQHLRGRYNGGSVTSSLVRHNGPIVRI
jgi:hypothetical protein